MFSAIEKYAQFGKEVMKTIGLKAPPKAKKEKFTVVDLEPPVELSQFDKEEFFQVWTKEVLKALEIEYR